MKFIDMMLVFKVKASHTFYKKHAKVLNIIGDLGNGSYGRVDNKSYLSLQYLVSGGVTVLIVF